MLRKEVIKMDNKKIMEGKVVQVVGPVVDVLFPKGHLPEINNAIEIDNRGTKLVVEVAVPPNI